MTLIERLEAATAPSRELDAEIFWADRGLDFESECPVRSDGRRHIDYRHVPHYTGSLDAARSLGGLLVFASDIGADGLPMVKLVFDTSTSPVVEFTGIAATLELAYCIAALKAREALGNIDAGASVCEGEADGL